MEPKPSQERTRARRRPLVRQVARMGERQIDTLSRSDRIDAIARPLQTKMRSLLKVPGGRVVKDLLNGTWLGHPVHPTVTDVPMGAWTTAVTFDALTATGRTNLDRGARSALGVGIAGAVGAVLTGLSDWSDTGKEQRRVGLVHATLNVIALGLEIASFVGRGRGWRGSKVYSMLGFGVASSAAYLGGNLVYRLGTQVDRTAWSSGLPSFTPAIADSELPSEKPTRAEVSGVPILLVRHDGAVFAMEDTCGHAGCPLSSGRLDGGTIVCPCHGSTYRLEDGAVIHGPSSFPQPTLEVRLIDGRIHLRSRPI